MQMVEGAKRGSFSHCDREQPPVLAPWLPVGVRIRRHSNGEFVWENLEESEHGERRRDRISKPRRSVPVTDWKLRDTGVCETQDTTFLPFTKTMGVS